jgi:hypothetical protein
VNHSDSDWDLPYDSVVPGKGDCTEDARGFDLGGAGMNKMLINDFVTATGSYTSP